MEFSEQFIAYLEKIGEDYLQLHKLLTNYFIRKAFQNAEDLASKTLDRVAKHLGEGRPMPNFKAYVLRVAGYIAMEEWKKQRENPMDSLDDPDANYALSDTRPDPLAEVLQKEELSKESQMLICMRACLDKLAAGDEALLSGPLDRRGKDGAQIQAAYRHIRALKAKLRECVENCMRATAKERR